MALDFKKNTKRFGERDGAAHAADRRARRYGCIQRGSTPTEASAR